MASMKFSEALTKNTMLKNELNEINRLISSSKMALSILPYLVNKEFHRLDVDIYKALCTLPPMDPFDTRVPLEGELMLSQIPTEFKLWSAEATEMFKQTLTSELETLMTSTPQLPATAEFIHRVIDHTDTYLKKQLIHECAVFGPKDDHQIFHLDYNAARMMRDTLLSERNIIRNIAMVTPVEPRLLILMDSEIDRLNDDIKKAILSMDKNMSSDEIKVPLEGAYMLSSVPAKFGLVFASHIEMFIQTLQNVLRWVMNFPDQLPLTFQFIQRVIGHAERYMMEKRVFEVAVFGRA